MTKFFSFDQNCPNGDYDFIHSEEKGISEIVCIEAEHYWDANEKAEKLGLKFDEEKYHTLEKWRETTNRDGYDTPKLFAKPLAEFKQSMPNGCAFVHFLDGRIEKVELKKETKPEVD